MNNKLAFFNKLEEIYLGAEIKEMNDNSGFTNLLSIKKKYFEKVQKEILAEKVDDEVYNKLYTFFDVYLNETGTPYFNSTPVYKNVSARVYSNNDDTALFYKTRDLYYVKSDAIYKSLEINVRDYVLFFDAADWVQSADNSKNLLEIRFEKLEKNRLCFKVLNKTQKQFAQLKNVFKQNSNEFGKEFLEAISSLNITEDEIRKAIRDYKKQNEVDFFVHKDARKFLKEQFNQYLYNYLFDDENIDVWSEDRIKQIKNIKNIAFKTIDLIADFENELRAMWLKPKFAKNTNYIISFNEIVKRLGLEYAKSIVSKKQRDEWVELEAVSEAKPEKLDENAFYPIDTKYLKTEDKYRILSSIENLDDALCGEVIKADNFQVLNTLKNKYHGCMDLIYIDPPFNTGSDFVYKDKFQDSTWLTLMENRLSLGREWLSNQGSFYLHLDHNANYLGRILMNGIFGRENFRNDIIWQYFMGGKGNKEFGRKHDTILFYSKVEKANIFNKFKIKRYLDFVPSMKDESKDAESGKDEIGYYSTVACPDVWSIKSLFNMSKEYLNFDTQKTEELLQRIIKASSNVNSWVCDFFSGSGTTIVTAYKMKRRFLGVEMGAHFYDVILPRIKKAMYGFVCGISETLGSEVNKGGIVRYYELETYEDVLKNAEYVNDEQGLIDYMKSNKMIKNLDKGQTIKLNLADYYKNIDIFTSISNITGSKIVKLDEHSCIFDDGAVINDCNLDLAKYPFLKQYIYWSSK